MTNLIKYLLIFLLPSALLSCADDNVHQPDVSNEIHTIYLKMTGNMTTSVPDMPVFEPVESEEIVSVTINGNKAEACFTAFDIDIPMMNRVISIGDMEIYGVSVNEVDGVKTLSAGNFECQGGDYIIKGSLQGEISSGKAEITILYRPGSMPFECRSTFTSNL